MIKKQVVVKRQEAIEELVQNNIIEDQEELIELLDKKYNIKTNQAAMSRDLRRLGVFKRIRGNVYAYALPSSDIIIEILQHVIRSIEHNESLIVVHTLPGTAAMVGDFLDAQEDLNIIGTLAGENIVFIAPTSVHDIAHIIEILNQKIKVKG